ncbi:hypothetical protein AK812_SmicGene43091 [Symbiodinium microadriaticum]|uniref:Uncharacterized protein n=1 Tax=Symbiodinium microadriaticum TaxID=2951 RepID=A0A1Q9C1X2_SYMMI|nr:hypothetical protein AK812_SmicGene43091 [Symbiodinium microadriaticum]
MRTTRPPIKSSMQLPDFTDLRTRCLEKEAILRVKLEHDARQLRSQIFASIAARAKAEARLAQARKRDDDDQRMLVVVMMMTVMTNSHYSAMPGIYRHPFRVVFCLHDRGLHIDGHLAKPQTTSLQ